MPRKNRGDGDLDDDDDDDDDDGGKLRALRSQWLPGATSW